MASKVGGSNVQEKQHVDLLVLGSGSKKLKDQSRDDEMYTKCADPKVESESGESDDEPQDNNSFGRSPSDDDPYPLSDSSECDCNDCDGDMHKYWYKYKKQLHKSSGYYVDSYYSWTPRCWGSAYGLKASEIDRSDPVESCILEGFNYAIEEYNKRENPKLKLEEIIYVVVSDGLMHQFKVTFLGKDVSSGETDYYQTYFIYKDELNKSLMELQPEPACGATHYLEKKGKDVPKRTSQRVADA